MAVDAHAAPSEDAKPDLQKITLPYQQPDLRKALWQVVDTLIPYSLLWYLMVRTVQRGYPYGITLALAAIASAFLTRTFIIFHDCTHSAFFASRHANTALGYICGILTFTPYEEWRRTHAIHHVTVADLDRRGTGDVWTMTVDEFQAAPRRVRLAYRVLRNPLALLGLGPIFDFLLFYRFAGKGAQKRERTSVYITNAALLAIMVVASLIIGLRTYVLVQLPVVFITGACGIWLFYVQHQFEGVYWSRHEAWDPLRAALEGSSHYQLPGVLQWVSGHIGMHHIHHIRPRIPNYNLLCCYDEIPALQAVRPLSIGRSLKSLRLTVYDEQRGQLVSFRSLRARPHSSTPAG